MQFQPNWINDRARKTLTSYSTCIMLNTIALQSRFECQPNAGLLPYGIILFKLSDVYSSQEETLLSFSWFESRTQCNEEEDDIQIKLAR